MRNLYDLLSDAELELYKLIGNEILDEKMIEKEIKSRVRKILKLAYGSDMTDSELDAIEERCINLRYEILDCYNLMN